MLGGWFFPWFVRPFYIFMEWENRRRKKGTPIRNTKLSLFIGLLWCLFWYGGFIAIVTIYILEADGEPISWIPLVIVMFLFSLPGLYFLRRYFKRYIIAYDDYFLECFGKKVTKISYSSIIQYEIVNSLVKLKSDDFINGLIIVIDSDSRDTGERRGGTATKQKKLSGIGLYELYEKIDQYKKTRNIPHLDTN